MLMTTKFRAQFDGHALIPLDPVDLPTGQVLEIEANRAEELDDEHRPGSPKAILRVMRSLPAISEEDVQELLRVIEESQLPPVDGNIFGDGKE